MNFSLMRLGQQQLVCSKYPINLANQIKMVVGAGF